MSIVRRGPRVPEQAQHFWPTTKRLIAYLRPWRVGVVVSIFLAIVSVILSILAPKILGEATTIIYDGMLSEFPISIGTQMKKQMEKDASSFMKYYHI